MLQLEACWSWNSNIGCRQQAAYMDLRDKDYNQTLSFLSLFMNRWCWHPQNVRWGIVHASLRVVRCLTTRMGCIKRSACRLRFAHSLRERSPRFCDRHCFISRSATANTCSIAEQDRKGLWATQKHKAWQWQRKKKSLPPEQKTHLNKITLFA